MGGVNFNVVNIKITMRTGACLNAVVNIHIIIVFAHTTFIMEVNPLMVVTFC